MIDAYITNLGKYVAGNFCGERLTLPADKEDVQALLARIGVDGVLYEEIIITEFQSEVSGLASRLNEYDDVDELNYLAALLDEMDGGDIEKLEAAIAYGEHTGSVGDIINLTQNLDCYEFYPGVTTEEELGYYLIDEMELLEIPEHLVNYIDYEAYGRDAHLNGGSLTNMGYVEAGNGFTEYYGGKDDIPDEYRIFAYPDPPEKMPMKAQLEMYGRMAAVSRAAADRPAQERAER